MCGLYTGVKAFTVYTHDDDGNPMPGAPGELTYVYTISNDPTSLIEMIGYNIDAPVGSVVSAGHIDDNDLSTPPPSGLVNNNDGVVRWDWTAPNLIDVGDTADQLFIISTFTPGPMGDAVFSIEGNFAFDVEGTCTGPLDPPPAGGNCLLLIDEDSIDNGNPPNFFDDIIGFGESGADVNDDMPELAQRQELRFFDQNEGLMISLHTGEVGDEGWFSPKSFPNSWETAGPTTDRIRNFVGNPGHWVLIWTHPVSPGLNSLPSSSLTLAGVTPQRSFTLL